MLVRAEAEGPTVVHQHRHMALPLAEAAGSCFDRDGVVVTTEQAEGFAAVGAAGWSPAEPGDAEQGQQPRPGVGHDQSRVTRR